jgi:hypothetical protein
MSKPPNHGRSVWQPLADVAPPVPFGSRGCKWPLDIFDEDGIRMACGCRKDAEESYCATHIAVAYQVRDKTKRVREPRAF